jgi:hypothetical protein
MVRFLGDPKIPHGSRSERGTHGAAPFYSLIESAKLCGVEPRAYLREIDAGSAAREKVIMAEDLLLRRPSSPLDTESGTLRHWPR